MSTPPPRPPALSLVRALSLSRSQSLSRSLGVCPSVRLGRTRGWLGGTDLSPSTSPGTKETD